MGGPVRARPFLFLQHTVLVHACRARCLNLSRSLQGRKDSAYVLTCCLHICLRSVNLCLGVLERCGVRCRGGGGTCISGKIYHFICCCLCLQFRVGHLGIEVSVCSGCGGNRSTCSRSGSYTCRYLS